jgi:hypothetical protein
MRTVFALAALAAISLMLALSARAQTTCVDKWFAFVPNGVASAEGHTRSGQPCQMTFGVRGANIEALRTTVRPSHGILGSSEKEGNKRYIAYAPKAGYVGRDRFEVYIQYTPAGAASSLMTRVRVEMNVTP